MLGNEVDGGKVHGALRRASTADALYEGRDLPVTTDFRVVFSELAGRHLGVADTKAVFPEWDGKRLSLFRNPSP